MTRLSLLLLAGAAIAATCASTVRAAEVALTFDDVPGLMLGSNQSYEDAFNRDLLGVLVRRHVPATGFVIGRELEAGERARRGP